MEYIGVWLPMRLKISSVQTGVVWQTCNYHGNPIFLHFSYYFFTFSGSGLQEKYNFG